MSDEDIAMQVRCVACHREQYAPAVLSISVGATRCECGYLSKEMTVDEYRAAMKRWAEGK